MKKPKRILSVLLCALAISPVCSMGLTNNNTNAVNIADLNASSVFVKQQQSNTCTLAANVMLLRRAALLRGDSDWQQITESACRSVLWSGGMRLNYTYKGISVKCERIYGNSTEKLKSLLSEHPEGIVAYDYNYPHAILLTDYTNGKFYCSDPARCIGAGRIEASSSLINTAGIEAYWYVATRLPSVSNMKNTSRLSKRDIQIGDKVSVLGSAEGNEGKCVYTYQYKESGQTAWTTIGNAATSNTSVDFVPKNTGNYDIKVTVEDSTGSRSEKSLNLSVYESVRNKSRINSYVVNYGDDLTVNLSASGGSGKYQYEINASKPSSSSWVRLKGYSSGSVFTYHPWEAGFYKLIINAKDTLTGKVSSDIYMFRVAASKLENQTKTNKRTISFGNDLTFSLASAGGAGGICYDIKALKPSTSEWVVLKNNHTSSTYTYHPWEEGTYQFKVTAKDNSGNTSVKTFSLHVNIDKLVNYTQLVSNEVAYGDDLIIKTASTGGTGSYKYDFSIVKPGGKEWVNIRKYITCSTFSYRPWEKGVYKLCVNVKDSSGNVTNKYFSFNVV